jgi:hypothetical protein
MEDAILNGNKISNDWGAYSAALRLVSVASLSYGDVRGWRWHDDSVIVAEPLLAWGPVNVSDEGRVRGQLRDALMVSDAFTDSTISFDGKTWYAITCNNVGAGNGRASGTLLVLIP